MNENFLTEALRILKLDGSLIIYEPLSLNRNPGTVLTYPERISRLKLSGFKVKDPERKNLDTDLESKNLLLKVYNNMEDICKVSASKPSFEVKKIFFLYSYIIKVVEILYTVFRNNLGRF